MRVLQEQAVVGVGLGVSAVADYVCLAAGGDALTALAELVFYPSNDVRERNAFPPPRDGHRRALVEACSFFGPRAGGGCVCVFVAESTV
jgi:hypothetical protein